MKFTHLLILVLIVNAKAFIFSEDQCQEVYKHLAKGVGIGAIPAIIIASGYGALSAIGFTSTGIAGGSMAAAAQASVGNVVAGSLFSSLQSAAMIGMSWILTPALVIGGIGASAYVSTYVYDCYASFKHYSNSDPGFKDRVDKKVKEAQKKEQQEEQAQKTKEQEEKPIQQEEKQNFNQDPSN